MTFIEKILFESLLLEKRQPKKGCIMLNLDFPKIKSIQDKINEDDLYIKEGPDSYGLEKDCHVTLLYGLEASVTNKDVKEIIEEFSFPKTIEIHNVSCFEQDDYDVLKFDVKTPHLKKINKKLTSLPYKNDYPDYHPHLTIAYLKKGKSKEYVKMFAGKEFKLSPVNCVFSTNAGKTTIKIKN